MDCSLPGSSIHGIFQPRVLEWGAIAFSMFSGFAFQKKPLLSCSPGYGHYFPLKCRGADSRALELEGAIVSVVTWGALSYVLVGFRVRGLPAGVEQTVGSGGVVRLLPLPEAPLPLPACPDIGTCSSCSPSARSLQPFQSSALPQCRSDPTARRC